MLALYKTVAPALFALQTTSASKPLTKLFKTKLEASALTFFKSNKSLTPTPTTASGLVRARARDLAQLKLCSTVLKQLNPKYQFNASARKAEAKLKPNAVKQPVLASELASFVLTTIWHNETAQFSYHVRQSRSCQQAVPWNKLWQLSTSKRN
ncbi:MAG: hypothetical protein P3M75_00240 [Candidatus Hodgkinia cicadicola]|nr:MAG: hypothetical protein P3M75_00240 [Candidatus Hodgkinia cicadicola]